jgi:N-methylhydantoinase B
MKDFQLDPIQLEIISNGLRSVADETYVALMRSAYSTNIKERHDHSTAIMDMRGRLVAQAQNSLPIHLGSMKGLLDALLAKHDLSTMRSGDIFAANDPFIAGGTHLPDVNLAMPVFAEDKVLCFVCNIAHHADIGGMAPGSMAGGMHEIYQEGLRIPVIRLFRQGELDPDLFDILLINARLPEERRGDYFAQIAACRLGSRRVGEMVGRYGSSLLRNSFDEIILRTEMRLREALKRIPPGSYSFSDVMDDDGLGSFNIPIRVSIEVPELAKGQILFNFTGSSPQVRGNINMTLNATEAAVLYTLKSLLDPDLPNNQGLMNVVEIIAPPGTITNAIFPAAVAARANTCQRVVDVILGALAHALPNSVVGAANGANTTAVFSGYDQKRGRNYLYLETLGGGFGGRATKDGKDGVQVHITNTSNLPVESIETEFPLLVEEYALVENSGGAGRCRGGMGIRRVISPVDHTATFSGQGERFANQPWGIFGGKPGARGSFSLRDAKGCIHSLPIKPSSVALAPDSAILIETPGAGGYGPPAERSNQAIEEDLRSHKFTEQFLSSEYGFKPALK